MAQFSRRTILAATDIIANWSHNSIDRFVLEHGLENAVALGSRADKAMNLARYLLQHTDAQNEDDADLTDAVVGDIVGRAIENSMSG